jgi:hypothetical protein
MLNYLVANFFRSCCECFAQLRIFYVKQGMDCRASLAMTDDCHCEEPCVGAQDRLRDVAISNM